jgi:hypothetical protein
MKRYFRTLSLLLLCTNMAAAQPAPEWDNILPPELPWRGKSARLVAKAQDPWITPAEQSNFTTTPDYATTRAWLDRLDASSSLFHIERFGASALGREMYAVIGSTDPQALDPDKPLVLVQAGIHSGEIDGKDAGLMLLRDIAFRNKQQLLDRVNLVFIPIFNPDGHENHSAYSRPNQRGPVSQGWRTTAQNINLNRDYAKADSPEMQSLFELIRRHDPDLYLDLHVTDGVDYVHDITFSFPGWGGHNARSVSGGEWLDRIFRPEVERALHANGHLSGPYISPIDARAPEKGIFMRPARARTSTGFGDLRRVPTVLVENHSLKPYRQRVLGTYILVEQALKSAATHGAQLLAARSADLQRRPGKIDLAWQDDLEQPIGSFMFHPIEREMYRSAASGHDEVRWLGRKATPVSVPVFTARPVVTVDRPAAYWIPAAKTEVLDRLRRHGMQMEVMTSPRTVRVELTRLIGGRHDPGAEKEGRFPFTADEFQPVQREITYASGSVRIATDQALGELASVLLEPRSKESFLAWGFFPEILQRTEYIDGYVIAPLADRMLQTNPDLAREFSARLSADPTFAGDPEARLAWFYELTPFFDAAYAIYPVGRELATIPTTAAPATTSGTMNLYFE